VIHDFIPSILDDRFANPRRDIVKGRVPGGALPFAFAAFAGALEWIKNAIGIMYLVERRRPLAQLRPRDPGCSGLPSNFCTSPVTLSM